MKVRRNIGGLSFDTGSMQKLLDEAIAQFEGYTGEDADGKVFAGALKLPSSMVGPDGRKIDLRRELKGMQAVLTHGGTLVGIAYMRMVEGRPQFFFHGCSAKEPTVMGVDPKSPDSIYFIGGNLRLSSDGPLRGYVNGHEEEFAGVQGQVHSNPEWVLDHPIWDQAKNDARKQRSEDHGQFWPLVTTLYKKYGGRTR